jgi:hypothetical protein
VRFCCILLALVVPLLPACGEQVRSGSFMLDKETASFDFATVKRRASFELRCPRSQIEIVTLDAKDDRASQVGAEGCGQRAIYLRRGDEWVLNSSAR